MTRSGRVTFARRGDDNVFVIPAKRGWKTLFSACWLAGWVMLPLPIISRAIHSPTQTGPVDWFDLLWTGCWAFGVVAVAWTILWSIGGTDIVRLTPSTLELAALVFGIPIKRRVTPLEEVRNLRYVPPYRQGRRSRESSICYEDLNGTAKFGAELQDAEAFSLIEQMLNVYPFTKRDRALGYMDLNG